VSQASSSSSGLTAAALADGEIVKEVVVDVIAEVERAI